MSDAKKIVTDWSSGKVFRTQEKPPVLPRTVDVMKEYLRQWPTASVKELRDAFGNKLKHNEAISFSSPTHFFTIKLDEELLDLLKAAGAEPHISEGAMAIVTSDGFLWEQPKGAYVMKGKKKFSLAGKVLSFNWSLKKEV